MPAESVRTSKSPSTSPATASPKLTAADKLLLPAVQTLVPLAVMLTSECFSTDCTYKRSLVRMSAKMRSKIVSPSKLFGAEIALERCWMLLDALFRPRGWWPTWVGKFKDVIPVRNRRGRRPARRGSRCGRSISGAGNTVGIAGVVWRERSMSLVDLRVGGAQGRVRRAGSNWA